ncbi:MAG: ribosome biogenesis GTPase Der [Gammaproteobacteria bacterium RIFCSPHIGHO2_12_FULL_35_23]|nr:MAG: ribosome biogenesis GTPase Der [Gammaproteobacteria bacterium RIFCSPHIGHO2_12_FULL_35_23]
MIPVIAIVGRPNVGKSTLFNQITKTRDALVADVPGVTRDRQYGDAEFEHKKFIIIDTGGVGDEEPHSIDPLMANQSWLAAAEATSILFLVDAKSGITAADEAVVKRLRKLKKTVYLVVNKTEGLDLDIALAEFYQLGLGEPIAIAAVHNRGIKQLLTKVTAGFSPIEAESQEDEKGIKIAIVGKPNVGKSTLVNRILGEERVVVFDQPGTTRDSIFIPFERFDKQYTLIDTAGIRRRSRIDDSLEKFSVIKTLQAIEAAQVVIFVIDARENITDQDLKLLGFVLRVGKAIIITVNKWDGLTSERREEVRRELERRLAFIDFARIHFISALHGTGVGDLYAFIDEAYAAAMQALSTAQATKLLEAAVAEHQPPMVGGRRIKLRYAHIGGHNPPIIVIHGNQLDKLPGAYKRYLVKYYRDKLKMIGTPIRLELKVSNNPYK